MCILSRLHISQAQRNRLKKWGIDRPIVEGEPGTSPETIIFKLRENYALDLHSLAQSFRATIVLWSEHKSELPSLVFSLIIARPVPEVLVP